MGFLKRLFGGGGDDDKDRDPHGIYVYARCDRCQTVVRVRIDKRHDLLASDSSYIWRKTIVDNKCFQRMPTTVYFDKSYNVITQDLENGAYVDELEYEAFLAQKNSPVEEDQPPTDE